MTTTEDNRYCWESPSASKILFDLGNFFKTQPLLVFILSMVAGILLLVLFVLILFSVLRYSGYQMIKSDNSPMTHAPPPPPSDNQVTSEGTMEEGKETDKDFP